MRSEGRFININNNNDKKIFQALEIGKTFGKDVVYGFPYQTGEKSHEMPQKRCILLPPKVDCKKAPWQRANHLGNTKRVFFRPINSDQTRLWY